MATVNQCIKSFMPKDDSKWISQLNLKKFKPIGSEAKNAMKKVFANDVDFKCLCNGSMVLGRDTFDRFKEGLSLERFDDATFLRILGVLVATPKFRQDFNVPFELAHDFVYVLSCLYENYFGSFDDVILIWESCEENGDLY